MAIRSVAQLKQSQAELLSEYKRQFDGDPAAVPDDGTASAVSAPALIGRIDEVVLSDAIYGPHLKVVLQHFSSAPPAASDAHATRQVYYPVPGKSVGDYAAGAFVLLIRAGGGRFAVGI